MARKKLSPPEGDHCSYATIDFRLSGNIRLRDDGTITVQVTSAHADGAILADDRFTQVEGGAWISEPHHADNGAEMQRRIETLGNELAERVEDAAREWGANR